MLRSSALEVIEDGRPLQVRPVVSPAGTSEVGDLWRILLCRRKWVLGVAAVCTAIALAYVMATPAQYTAVAQVLIDPRDRQILSKDVNPDTLASDGGVLQVESQARVIESDAVLLRAIRSLKLAGDPDFGKGSEGLAMRLFDMLRGASEPDDPASNEDRALRVLRRHLAIKRADKVFVVDIVVSAKTGPRAARIADAIGEAYLADQAQARSDSTSTASQALASHLDELRAGVTEAAARVQSYKADHGLLGTDKQTISDQQLNDNGTQLNNARARVAELGARVDQLDAFKRGGEEGGATQEAIQSPVVTQLRAALADLDRRRSDMRTRLGDRFPDLIAIDAEARQARASLAAEIDRIVRSAHGDLDRARKAERALAATQNQLKQQTASNDQASVTLHQLDRELDARRAVYQAFLARAGETREQTGIDSTNSRIISRAIAPLRPSWPPSLILPVAALFGGLGLGAALAFALQYRFPTILSPGQLERAAAAPVVGTVSGPRAGGRRPGRRGSAIAEAGWAGSRKVGTALGLALGRLCGPLDALRHRPTPYTLLVASTRDVVRSGIDVPARLASAASGNDLSVLLVDADPTRAVGASGPQGFLNVLNGECTLRTAMVQDGSARTYWLGIGTSAGRGTDAMGEDRLRQFLRMTERRFDVVVFDGGCFGADLGAAPLAARVDDVLLVARRGETPESEVGEMADAVAVAAGRPVSAALLVDGLRRL